MNTTDLTQITGYRTNRSDKTETLAWAVRTDGFVECVHAAPDCCKRCVRADARLFQNHEGAVVARFRAGEVVDGRTVRFSSSRG